MATLIHDRDIEREIIVRRQRLGQDHYDEVWNGVYFMVPAPNIEHQDVMGELSSLFRSVVQEECLGVAYPGINVSDQRLNWKKNFRVPDVAVFLNGTSAINCDTHWFGGPDLAIEVVSKKDRTKKKLGFYGKVGTREILIVDRYPWSLSLFRLAGEELELVASTSVETGVWLELQVLPLKFRLIAGVDRPRIEVRQNDGSQNWIV